MTIQVPNLKIACVVGARPNFMKMAPLLRAVEASGKIDVTLIHTGQHYDQELSSVFFEQLEIPKPDISLEVGSGSQAEQTARILERIEPVLQRGVEGRAFDWLVVVGDVNSTMAAAIAAAKLGIPVAHVEAGLRSFDRKMPEEINRLVTDSISTLMLVSDPAGMDHLRREGHGEEKLHLVGNLMIDTLFHSLAKAKSLDTLKELNLEPKGYGVVTLHRPSNVDDRATLSAILDVLQDVSQDLPLAFPIHPRTRSRIENFGLIEKLAENGNIRVLPPLGYLEFLALTSGSRVIVTDSGGLQEESTALSIPCLTMRENTERPITVTEGSSTLVGNDAKSLRRELDRVLTGSYDVGKCPPLWDGNAAGRIVDAMLGTSVSKIGG